MRTIAVEEHYMSPGSINGPGRGFRENATRGGGRMAEILEKLIDVGEKRIVIMDEAQIDLQVLSVHAPGAEQSQGA